MTAAVIAALWIAAGTLCVVAIERGHRGTHKQHSNAPRGAFRKE